MINNIRYESEEDKVTHELTSAGLFKNGRAWLFSALSATEDRVEGVGTNAAAEPTTEAMITDFILGESKLIIPLERGYSPSKWISEHQKVSVLHRSTFTKIRPLLDLDNFFQ